MEVPSTPTAKTPTGALPATPTTTDDEKGEKKESSLYNGPGLAVSKVDRGKHGFTMKVGIFFN